MMRWLRSFFAGSDDPIVKVAGALSDPEAEMWREVLEQSGIVAMVKYVGALGGQGFRPPGTKDFELFVKQSDVERTREILAPHRSNTKDSRRRRRGAR